MEFGCKKPTLISNEAHCMYRLSINCTCKCYIEISEEGTHSLSISPKYKELEENINTIDILIQIDVSHRNDPSIPSTFHIWHTLYDL